PHTHAVPHEFGGPRTDLVVLRTQHGPGPGDHSHRNAERSENVCELRRNEATTEDDRAFGEFVDPHHRVRSVVVDFGQPRDVRHDCPAAGGEYEPVRCQRFLGSTIAVVNAEFLVTGESSVPGVHGHVGVVGVFGTVLFSAGRDRVDPAEDAVADVTPAHPA